MDRHADGLGTLACSPSPVPLKWHMWAFQEHSYPCTNQPQQMSGIGTLGAAGAASRDFLGGNRGQMSGVK